MNIEPNKYWAHSDPELRADEPGNRWQLLAEHLDAVAEMARILAERATVPGSYLGKVAFAAGMLHDYGKYQDCFQKRLFGANRRCPHAIYGAIALRHAAAESGGIAATRAILPAVCAVAAHHAGLKDTAAHKMDTEPHANGDAESTEVRELREIAKGLQTVAFRNQPRLREAISMVRYLVSTEKNVTQDMQTRMLLSCLVDADRLHTAGYPILGEELRPAERLDQLTQYLEGVMQAAQERGTAASVLATRGQVQRLCAEVAQHKPGLFSLCVPTGGGKTLAAMRFALEHAAARPGEMRRVIVVIPYLSIIEQNARVYAEVFGTGSILEHHSGAVYRKIQDAAASGEDEFSPTRPVETENWDAPVIVTTSVHFFESLFSNHPSDLRRIHNIARSVIVLDEVQTLPRRLLVPLLGMLRELVSDWGCSVVLSTATQPAFEAGKPRQKYLWPAGSVTPIVPEETAAEMARTLQRVRIAWEIRNTVSWGTLAIRLAQHPQVLCVVNLRDHATALYDTLHMTLEQEADDGGLFHLSTRMCAEHRLEVLDIVQRRLQDGLPCRIVSTQLIEAGVDLDVPVAFRALGPLDSIVQVAGRVDREGRATARMGEPGGRLIVFRPEDDRYPGKDYGTAAVLTQGVLDEFEQIDTHNLEAIRTFFSRYYSIAGANERGDDLDRMRQGNAPRFRSLADEFAIIEQRTVGVFVPHGEGRRLLEELARKRDLNLKLLRRLQRYTVSLQRYEFEAAKAQGLFEVWPGSELWRCDEAQYSGEKGLLPALPDATFLQ